MEKKKEKTKSSFFKKEQKKKVNTFVFSLFTKKSRFFFFLKEQKKQSILRRERIWFIKNRDVLPVDNTEGQRIKTQIIELRNEIKNKHLERFWLLVRI